jgi:hypothetical protein
VLVLSVQLRDGTYGGFSTYGRLRPATKMAMHVTAGYGDECGDQRTEQEVLTPLSARRRAA